MVVGQILHGNKPKTTGGLDLLQQTGGRIVGTRTTGITVIQARGYYDKKKNEKRGFVWIPPHCRSGCN
jgi:hypothetical protein